MTRSGDAYVRGLRDGRTVLLDGERVAEARHDQLLAFEPFEGRVQGAPRNASSRPFLEDLAHRHGIGVIAALEDGEQEQVLEFTQIYGLIRHCLHCSLNYAAVGVFVSRANELTGGA